MCSYTEPPPSPFSPQLLENAVAKEHLLSRYPFRGGTAVGKWWWWCDVARSPPPAAALTVAIAVPRSVLTRTKSSAKKNWKQMLLGS